MVISAIFFFLFLTKLIFVFLWNKIVLYNMIFLKNKLKGEIFLFLFSMVLLKRNQTIWRKKHVNCFQFTENETFWWKSCYIHSIRNHSDYQNYWTNLIKNSMKTNNWLHQSVNLSHHFIWKRLVHGMMRFWIIKWKWLNATWNKQKSCYSVPKQKQINTNWEYSFKQWKYLEMIQHSANNSHKTFSRQNDWIWIKGMSLKNKKIVITFRNLIPFHL